MSLLAAHPLLRRQLKLLGRSGLSGEWSGLGWKDLPFLRVWEGEVGGREEEDSTEEGYLYGRRDILHLPQEDVEESKENDVGQE